jgi:MFS family permease
MFGFTSTFFLLTLELQATRGLSALQSGLTTFPMAIGVMLIAQPASRIYRVVGPRRMILTGLIAVAVTLVLLGRADLGTSTWLLRALMLVRGIGFGLVLVPLQAATYATVAPKDTGRATAMYNVSAQVASSFGVALAATMLTSRLTQHGAILGAPTTRDAALSAFQEAFLVMALLGLVGSAIAFLIRDRDAAATMQPVAEPAVEGGTLVPVPVVIDAAD